MLCIKWTSYLEETLWWWKPLSQNLQESDNLRIYRSAYLFKGSSKHCLNPLNGSTETSEESVIKQYKVLTFELKFDTFGTGAWVNIHSSQDVSDFERGTIVGARWAGSISKAADLLGSSHTHLWLHNTSNLVAEELQWLKTTPGAFTVK